jgi:hypothetical protein
MNEVIRHKEDVFTIKNFITKDEADRIIAYLEMSVQMGYIKWNEISSYESYAMGFWEHDKNLIPFGFDPKYFHSLKDKIKKAGEECFGKEFTEISYHAQKWIKGAFADFHSDNSDKDGNPTAFQRSKYAIFLYLNDNFEGGYLNFEHYPINIKPEVGMIAIFKGGHGNEHEVTTVKSGERYTIGSFWDDADAVYTDEQKASWESELKVTRAEQDIMYKKWAEDKEKGIVPQYKSKYGL